MDVARITIWMRESGVEPGINARNLGKSLTKSTGSPEIQLSSGHLCL